MEMSSERKALADRYARMQAEEGLVDVKFLLSNPAEATTDEVYREVNAMYEALERKEAKVLDFGDISVH
ncbi:hypothetical protein [Sphingobium boeckii]|uniref:Uncharacterized protein n=1 Tax=Sphingobium boeckii TaxID=1082345 RepID=A0A7W9EE49_9SPHN|nr:hypothetical protein [Sphingobium boeckii]MBB5685639.1 hypothetical protein [Sphingobium boeckii]